MPEGSANLILEECYSFKENLEQTVLSIFEFLQKIQKTQENFHSADLHFKNEKRVYSEKKEKLEKLLIWRKERKVRKLLCLRQVTEGQKRKKIKNKLLAIANSKKRRKSKKSFLVLWKERKQRK